MIKRDYYKLKQAAEILACSEDDLIYLAAHSKVPVYVLSTKFNLCFRRYIKGNFVDSGYSHDQLAKLSLETLRELEAGSNDAIVILDRKPVSITEIEDKNLSSQSKQNNWDYLEFCPKGWLYIAPEKLSELYLSGKQIEHLWPPAIRINDCEMVIMADELERFKSKAVGSQIKTKEKIPKDQQRNDVFTAFNEQYPDYFKNGDKRKAQLQADLITFSGGGSLFQSGFYKWWGNVDKNIYPLKSGRPKK